MLLPIYIVGISCFLLGGFIIVTFVERKQGRLFGASRRRLDAYVARMSFIVRHIDWSSFVKHQLQTTIEKILHDIAHAVLMVIRLLERWLTRAVRKLREKRSRPEAAEPRQGVSVRAILQKLQKGIHFPWKKKSGAPEE
jgi:hypothetical protein